MYFIFVMYVTVVEVCRCDGVGERCQYPGQELENRQLGGKYYMSRVNVKSGHFLYACFGNFSLRIPERCSPVESQEVGVLMV